ncbi:ribonuclease PH [Salsipaludibacter albus]|uniref:ribonuclease PH n=1 Tax=Salsipaludibacter albus TaxID=2849650 RepID=UPI001EE3CD10|nr:ribonuclease PH [Salsipaludibacter albus]MBY5163895.1 ribonuclease PH [Salsipaludibacter albus]
MTRPDDRPVGAMRPVRISTGFQHAPAGSCLVEFGGTRVAVSASVAEGAPRWKASGGWVTAEYAMLPGSTAPRARRQRSGPDGRAKEIERLVGRSLRAVVDLEAVGERTVTVDCDVLDADGGTRTAAITGAWVALVAALRTVGAEQAVVGQVAAVSVGIVAGQERLDLEYVEDVTADVDANVVMTADGGLVEVQATAEGDVFGRAAMDTLLDLATAGCDELFAAQRAALG